MGVTKDEAELPILSDSSSYFVFNFIVFLRLRIYLFKRYAIAYLF